MTATLVSMLFAAAACLALGAIAVSWRSYGAAALSLRQQLAACDPLRELRFVTVTPLVRCESAQVWRPGFSAMTSRTQRPPRPVLYPGQRAAA